jgi:CRISPR-associated endonuclease/helicase Cas3
MSTGSTTAFFAHSANGAGEWQELSRHLRDVGTMAGEFARPFGAQDEARVAGLLHDLGKFRVEFQSYLRGERPGGVDTRHAAYGAKVAFEKNWAGCAFAVAGHHAGLHNLDQLQCLVEDPKYDLPRTVPVLEERFRSVLGPLPDSVTLPLHLEKPASSNIELYIRMIFSCLVDADFLDTERHFTGKARTARALGRINDLLLSRLESERKSKATDGPVNQMRHSVFEQCLAMAGQGQGFFSLTVPTGGGKTLSSMAFALAHARRWNLDRVIVVIPYLSIIEQNAAEYRRILDPAGEGLVVEHHSAVPVAERTGEGRRSPMDLAAENWDAPVIVTTSVQLIESLFASSQSKCRKLHNIARSVVMLDEVQTLPTHLLDPLLNVLRDLEEHYGVSFVFTTATQPAFRRDAAGLPEGFAGDEVTELVPDTRTTFSKVRRVEFRREGTLPWSTVAQRLAASHQSLCVLNVRRHAFELWEALRDAVGLHERDSVFHLSSAMCAEHRLDVLGEIRDPRPGSVRHRLAAGHPCRLVATQVVEAGADLDFPLTYRALGPLDSIVQAGGRCNREGRLVDERGRPKLGEVVIFTPENHALPGGVYKTASDLAAVFLDRHGPQVLEDDPAVFGEYFSQLFRLTATDHTSGRQSSIREDRENLRFRDVSEKAKVIDEAGVPVVVPYANGRQLIESLRRRRHAAGVAWFGRDDLRRLQRFMVNVRERDRLLLERGSLIAPIHPGMELFALVAGCYHDYLGLLIQDRPMEDLCGV